MSLFSRQAALTLNRVRSLAAEPGVKRKIVQANRELIRADTVLFFSEPPTQIYQLQVWLAPFERLVDAGHRVGVVVMNALTADALLQMTTLPIFFSRSIEQVEQRLRTAQTQAICYVNNAQANFTMLRFNGPRHIHLNHGESEKSSMVSNQLKAYDQVAVAGSAAVERIAATINGFDLNKLEPIGRPQLDAVRPRARTGVVRVLYAPTWEGDSQAMAYSSLLTQGESILQQLAAEARIELRFRPHPKTGSTSTAMAKLLANLQRSYGQHLDSVADPAQSLAESDVVICDISAMAYDALALNVPLLLHGSEPSELTRRLPQAQQLRDTENLGQRVLELAERGSAAQESLAAYFFATTTPTEATARLGQLVQGSTESTGN